MADGLTFLLELDSKLEGGFAFNKVLKQSEDQLKKLDGGMRQVEKTTGGLIATFKQVAVFEVFRRAVSGAIDLATELGHKVFEIGQEMLHAAAKAERTEVSFKLLMGVEGGEETLDWIEKIAKFTEFTDDELKGMAGDLAKVGFRGKDLRRAISATTDIAAFSKSGEAGADAAINALARLKRTGNIDNRVLGGLGIGEDAFFAELAKRTGLGVKTLKEKIDKGTLDTKESLETLYAMITTTTKKKLGGSGVDMSKTMNARLKHLKDIPDQFFQGLSKTSGFAKISGFMDKLLVAFDPDGPTGRKVFAALEHLVDTIGNVLGGVNMTDLVDKVSVALRTIADNVRPAVELFKSLAEAIHTTAVGLGLLARSGHTVTSMVGITEKSAGDSSFATKILRNLIPNRFLKPLPGKDPAMSIGKAIPTGMADGIMSGTGEVRDASTQMSTAATESVRSELGVKSPSRVFEEIGMMTGLGFQQGIEKSVAATDAVVRDAFGAPSSAGGGGGLARGSVEFNLGGIHVSVTGGGQDAQHIGETVAAKIQEIAPGMLQSAIERLALQAGGA